jgi:hypothetical protein
MDRQGSVPRAPAAARARRATQEISVRHGRAVMPFGETVEERAYIAGLLDGEGCIHIKRQPRRAGAKERIEYGLRVTIEMTKSESLFTGLAKRFGGSIHFRRRSKSNLVQWAWIMTGKTARAFLESIGPFVRIKKLEVSKALEFQQMLDAKPHQQQKRTPNDERRYEDYYNQLRRLKLKENAES